MTHAFFKALLFLAAGLVIHALDRRAGHAAGWAASRKLMPCTYWCFLVGSLALVGIPPFAGFFSKDSILAAALDARHVRRRPLGRRASSGTFLTGVYTFRMLLPRLQRRAERASRASTTTRTTGKEGPLAMFWPVAVLAVLVDRRRLDPVRAVLDADHELARARRRRRSSRRPDTQEARLEHLRRRASASSGIARRVGDLRGAPRRGAARAAGCSALLEQKLYWDELYDLALLPARPSWLARALGRAGSSGR